jgi:hypothetical protein
MSSRAPIRDDVEGDDMGGMGLLVVFILLLLLGQGVAILLGLTVERLSSPYTGLITFIAAYFALFWFSWKAAVWLTEPGKRLTKLLGGAERGPAREN